MRLIFAGTPEFAVPTLNAVIEAGHDVGVVVTQPDRPAGRGGKLRASAVKTFALSKGLAVFQPEDVNTSESLSVLREIDAKAMVIVAFGQKLSKELLDMPELGGYNVHASLLPKYRGAAPIAWTLIRGEKTTGVTIIRMTEKIDAGEMLAQRSIDVDPGWTEADLDAALSRLGAELMLEVLRELEDGSARSVPQDASGITFARRLRKSDGRIRWSKPARTIHNRVRGVTPWPGAFAFITSSRKNRSVRVTLTKTSPVDDEGSSAEPGTVKAIGTEGISLSTGDGLLRIERLKPAGGREMRAEDFARGYEVRPGMRFTDNG